MRYLTIQRRKSFVGSLAKLRVYIEDPASNDLTINNVTCRKLGELNNGEQKRFEIGENAARVYVIADKLSKGFCNEYYPLPAGSEHVSLSGKCRFNPAAGNAFRFDGVTDEAVLQNRKKSTAKGIPILIVAVIAGFLLGFFLTRGLTNRTVPKQFSKDGATVTLTNQFREASYEGYDLSCESKDAMVLAVKESFAQYPGMEELTLEEYVGYAQMAYPAAQGATLRQENGLNYLEYQTTGTDGAPYGFLVAFFKTDDAFWVFNFATKADQYTAKRAELLGWAKTVTFQ